MSKLTKPQIRKYKIEQDFLKVVSILCSLRYFNPHNNAIQIIRLKKIKFRADLGFNQFNLILKKEQLVVIPLLKSFSVEKIKLQHKALENEIVRTDMYFFEHKLVVETDEKGQKSKRRKRKTNKDRRTS